MAGPGMYLLDYFPRAGFSWRRGQGSPRILRSDGRDAAVQRALIQVHSNGGERRLRKRAAQALVVAAVALVAEKINDDEVGIRPGEGIIEYLERSAEFPDLSRALQPDVWAELIYQMAEARNKYERTVSQAEKDGSRDQLTALAFAVDDLLGAAGNRWDWMSLEFYVYPHLVGEVVDYEIDSSSDESDEQQGEEGEGGDDDNSDDGKGLPRRMGGLRLADEDEDEEDKDLPRQMEGLTLLDAEGDVEMGM